MHQYLSLLVVVPIFTFAGCAAKEIALADAPSSDSRRDEVVFASPGRIEGRGEAVPVGVNATGVVEALLVKQGDKVRRGDLIARIDCRETNSEISALQGDVEALKQGRVRLFTGARPEERETAAARISAATAILEHARSQYSRIEKLFSEEVIPRTQFDEALRALKVAESEFDAAEQQARLTNAPPLAEEVARIDAQIEAAAARARNAQERLDKCLVVSPISGTVLRTDVTVGQLLTTFNPQPIAILSDTSRLRVRAEVDERDIALAHKDGRVTVSVEAYPGKQFTGHVAVVTPMMGRKKVRTSDPAERADRDVLEVMIDLNPTEIPLPLGLRVTVQFLQ